jgi:hypothetical protein
MCSQLQKRYASEKSNTSWRTLMHILLYAPASRVSHQRQHVEFVSNYPARIAWPVIFGVAVLPGAAAAATAAPAVASWQF